MPGFPNDRGRRMSLKYQPNWQDTAQHTTHPEAGMVPRVATGQQFNDETRNYYYDSHFGYKRFTEGSDAWYFACITWKSRHMIPKGRPLAMVSIPLSSKRAIPIQRIVKLQKCWLTPRIFRTEASFPRKEFSSSNAIQEYLWVKRPSPQQLEQAFTK